MAEIKLLLLLALQLSVGAIVLAVGIVLLIVLLLLVLTGIRRLRVPRPRGRATFVTASLTCLTGTAALVLASLPEPHSAILLTGYSLTLAVVASACLCGWRNVGASTVPSALNEHKE